MYLHYIFSNFFSPYITPNIVNAFSRYSLDTKIDNWSHCWIANRLNLKYNSMTPVRIRADVFYATIEHYLVHVYVDDNVYELRCCSSSNSLIAYMTPGGRHLYGAESVVCRSSAYALIKEIYWRRVCILYLIISKGGQRSFRIERLSISRSSLFDCKTEFLLLFTK